MSLKEQIARDVETVFLNPEEFGVRIAVNGVETVAVEDGDQLNAYQAGGICQGERLYYCSAGIFDRLPRAGDAVTITEDGKKSVWRVERCREDGGLAELTLRAGR